MVSGILIAMAVVGAVGLFIGLFLGIAGIKFKVEVDEREEAVLSALPGNNCGGCGYAGCANPVSYTHLDVYKRQPVRLQE